ncbi:MAG: hypothetical protein ACOH18_01425 [Candidatus Saccharimonadaceae bacterium]
MNNEQPAAPQQPLDIPPVQPEPLQPGLPATGPSTVPPHKSKLKLVVILLVIIILALAGTLAWALLKDQKTTNTTSNTTTPAPSTSTTDTTKTLKTTKVTYEGTTATVQYPESWTVVDTTTTQQTGSSASDVMTLPGLYIKSDKGHYLHLFAVDGIGGTCDPDEDTYTLTKKISTATTGVYFAQYTMASGKTNVEYLSVHTATGSTEPAEGFKGTNICTISDYSIVRAPGDNHGVYVTLSDAADKKMAGTLHYDDISSDPEFIAMLQSLTVTKP